MRLPAGRKLAAARGSLQTCAAPGGLMRPPRDTDALTLEVVNGASHWIADERPDVVVARAPALFASP